MRSFSDVLARYQGGIDPKLEKKLRKGIVTVASWNELNKAGIEVNHERVKRYIGIGDLVIRVLHVDDESQTATVRLKLMR